MVFDVGGVLLDRDPHHLILQVIPGPLEMESFLANVCTWRWHDPHDRGASREVNVVAVAHVGIEAYLCTGPEPVLARLALVGR
jgi:hypothetical protein